MPIAPAAALNSLVASPETFLKLYPVRIFGATAASAVAQYALDNRGVSARPGSKLGTHKWHTTESFDIRSAAAGVHNATAVLFNAHSVHMDVGVAAMGFYRLDGNGPSVLLTGQLSGCSFVIRPAGGNALDVAHVKPVAPMTGAVLAANLEAAHAAASVYGATAGHGFYDSTDRVVSILGFRSAAGAWSIYAQKHDATTGDYRIRSVYRVYPNRTKL